MCTKCSLWILRKKRWINWIWNYVIKNEFEITEQVVIVMMLVQQRDCQWEMWYGQVECLAIALFIVHLNYDKLINAHQISIYEMPNLNLSLALLNSLNITPTTPHFHHHLHQCTLSWDACSCDKFSTNINKPNFFDFMLLFFIHRWYVKIG